MIVLSMARKYTEVWELLGQMQGGMFSYPSQLCTGRPKASQGATEWSNMRAAASKASCKYVRLGVLWHTSLGAHHRLEQTPKFVMHDPVLRCKTHHRRAQQV
jgi:hypothetical protein